MIKRLTLFSLLLTTILGFHFLTPSNKISSFASNEIIEINSYEELPYFNENYSPNYGYSRIFLNSNNDYYINFYYEDVIYRKNNIKLPSIIDPNKQYEIDTFKVINQNGNKKVILMIYQDVINVEWELINDEAHFNNFTEIYSYNDLPLINNGRIEIEPLEDDKYNISFIYSDHVYIRKNIGLPLVYDHDKNYRIDLTVKNDDESNKNVYMNFYLDETDNFQWELISGDYLANDVIEVPISEVFLMNPGLGNKFNYLLFFTPDIEMDDIYQIDLNYQTYKKKWFGFVKDKDSIKYHDVSILKEPWSNVHNTNNKFGNWLRDLIGFDEWNTISSSRNNNYEWEVLIPLNERGLFIDEVAILQFYYVTDGNYYEKPADHKPVTPPGTPDKTDEDIIEEIESIFQSIIDWFDNNKNSVIGIIVTILVVVLLAPVISLFTIMFRIISTILKMLLNGFKIIINIPIGLFKLIFTSNKKQNKYY